MKAGYYHYYISYCYIDSIEGYRLGMTEYKTFDKIKSYDDIMDAIKSISNYLRFQKIYCTPLQIVILSYQLIRNKPY